MIQRVQSIYLFLVVVILSFMLISPLAELILKDGQSVVFYSHAVKKNLSDRHSEVLMHTIPLMLMICLIAIISIINIFLFNRRILQMRICMLNIVLMIGLEVLFFFYYYKLRGSIIHDNHELKLSVVFPFITIVLTFLAYRGIHEDEMTVRSYDRLR